MDEAVEDGVADGRVGYDGVPVFKWQLAGDQGRPGHAPVVDDLQELAALGEGGEAPVVEHQEVGFRKPGHDERLPDPRRPRDEHVPALGQPVTGKEAPHDAAVEPPGMPPIDVLRTGVESQPGLLERPPHPFPLTRREGDHSRCLRSVEFAQAEELTVPQPGQNPPLDDLNGHLGLGLG